MAGSSTAGVEWLAAECPDVGLRIGSVSEAVHIPPVPVVDVAARGTGSALASCHDRLEPILLLRCFPFPKRYLMRPARIESSLRKRLPDEPRCLPGLVYLGGGAGAL